MRTLFVLAILGAAAMTGCLRVPAGLSEYVSPNGCTPEGVCPYGGTQPPECFPSTGTTVSAVQGAPEAFAQGQLFGREAPASFAVSLAGGEFQGEPNRDTLNAYEWTYSAQEIRRFLALHLPLIDRFRAASTGMGAINATAEVIRQAIEDRAVGIPQRNVQLMLWGSASLISIATDTDRALPVEETGPISQGDVGVHTDSIPYYCGRNYYYAPERVIVLAPGQGPSTIMHERCHARQHQAVLDALGAEPSIDLKEWYQTPEAVAFIAAVGWKATGGYDEWGSPTFYPLPLPEALGFWTHSPLEDNAWVCAHYLLGQSQDAARAQWAIEWLR